MKRAPQQHIAAAEHQCIKRGRRALLRLETYLKQQDANLASKVGAWKERLTAQTAACSAFIASHAAWRNAQFVAAQAAKGNPAYSHQSLVNAREAAERLARSARSGKATAAHGKIPGAPATAEEQAAAEKAAREALAVADQKRREAAAELLRTRHQLDIDWVQDVRATPRAVLWMRLAFCGAGRCPCLMASGRSEAACSTATCMYTHEELSGSCLAAFPDVQQERIMMSCSQGVQIETLWRTALDSAAPGELRAMLGVRQISPEATAPEPPRMATVTELLLQQGKLAAAAADAGDAGGGKQLSKRERRQRLRDAKREARARAAATGATDAESAAATLDAAVPDEALTALEDQLTGRNMFELTESEDSSGEEDAGARRSGSQRRGKGASNRKGSRGGNGAAQAEQSEPAAAQASGQSAAQHLQQAPLPNGEASELEALDEAKAAPASEVARALDRRGDESQLAGARQHRWRARRCCLVGRGWRRKCASGFELSCLHGLD